VFFISISSTAEINIPYLKIDVSLSKTEITSEEPLTLNFTFTNISDGEVSLILWDKYFVWERDKESYLESGSLKIAVLDSKGIEIPRRVLLCHPHSQFNIFSEHLKPEETITTKYPLHLRLSTSLKPGKYHIVVKSFALAHAYISSQINHNNISLITDTFSGPSLPLEVLPFNKSNLDEAYDVFMEKAQYTLDHPSGSWCGKDYSDIAVSVRTILWAEGPAAVPYQIDLIYDKDKGFRYWPPAIVNTWDNIVRYAIPEQIERVLEMARHPECKKDFRLTYTQYYTPGLAWAIHQWHANGSEEIKERTRELAEKLPDEDPCPQSMELGQYPYGKP